MYKRQAQECVDAVGHLVEHPAEIAAMKQANAAYYQQYLRPDRLIANSLAVVDKALDD